jgi:hypothetical protein
MASKEEVFKSRFAAVMADIEDNVGRPEELALIGSLADRILAQARQRDWSSFKANLTLADYRGLLTTFETQGNALARQGAMSRVRAIEVLACSLIARTQSEDVEIAADDQRLNRLIDGAIRLSRSTASANTKTS